MQKKLRLKFAYATNGRKIEEYDFIAKQQKTLDEFPTPQELLRRRQEDLAFDDNQMAVLTRTAGKRLVRSIR